MYIANNKLQAKIIPFLGLHPPPTTHTQAHMHECTLSSYRNPPVIVSVQESSIHFSFFLILSKTAITQF